MVAVVVASRDRAALLAESLAALGRCQPRPHRVVVVDSASADDAVAEAGAVAGAQVVRCPVPGLGRARNAGWRAVEEDLVLFTDDDCLADPGWVAAVVAAFTGPDAPAFVTGAVRADRAPPRRAGLTVSVLPDGAARRLGPDEDARTFGHGANMAWRRSALEALEGFDELLGVGSALRAAEDLDAWQRALDRGLSGYHAPDAVVVHRQWRTRRQALRSYYGYGMGAGSVAMKRLRMDGSTGDEAGLARRLVVDEGIVPVARALRRGHQMSALAGAASAAGAVRGALAARRLGVQGGHFVEAPPR